MAALAASLLSIMIQGAKSTCPFLQKINISSKPYIPGPPNPHIIVGKEVIDKYSEVVVIGDVHGCHDELLKLLYLIHQETRPENVLKIFVGDLVNKGPRNRDVIQYFMRTPHLMSVRGNHDEVVINEYLNVVLKDVENLREKNNWMKELTKEEVDFLINMPYTIRIPSLNCIIVHAGVSPGQPVEDMNHNDLIRMRNLIHDSLGNLKPTSNNKEGVAWASLYRGPDHVYFGHDAKRKLQKELFATGLDTGCVYGNELTAHFIYGRRRGDFLTVKAARAYQKVDK